MQRLGTPEDIAEAVAFLAGSAGRWTNGQTLYVNGVQREAGPAPGIERDDARMAPGPRRGTRRTAAVGAENLRDQAIFVNHAPGAIAPLDPELIQIRDAVGQLP